MKTLRIIVGGMVAQFPLGGVAWDYLQYVIGLAGLGHEVYYYEDSWTWPYNPIQRSVSTDGSYSAAFLDGFFRSYAPAMAERWHYDHLHETSYGMSREAFARVVRSADLFLNVSGATAIPQELPTACVKVFLDTDPGFNQFLLVEKPDWFPNIHRWVREVASHDRHLTYAENMDASDCLVPKTGHRWIATRMGIVADLWDPLARMPVANDAPWSTVTTWNQYAHPLVYKGVEYYGKGTGFAEILELPTRIKRPFRLAVGGTEIPEQKLKELGWIVEDGPQATLTPDRYQNFLAESRGEISTAKQIYVAMRTGWFSCRSACYLAAGRPVAVQDTGFSKYLPTGEGLLAFSTEDEAAAGIDEIEANYQRHQRRAREVAGDCLDTRVVLPKMLKEIGFG